MMKREYTSLHVMAQIIGMTHVLTDAGSNVEFMWRQLGTIWDTNLLMVIVVAIGGAFALSVVIKSWQQKDYVLALWVFLGFCFASIFSLSATYNRVATTSQVAAQEILKNDEEYKSLYLIYQSAVRDAGIECSPGRGGRGDNCEKAETAVTALKKKLKVRKGELDVNFAGVSGDLTMLALPLALWVLGNGLLAFGINGRKIPPEFVLDKPDTPQEKARRFVLEYVSTNGKTPTLKLVMERTGVSVHYARKAIKA